MAHGQGKPATASGGGVGWFLANDSKVKDETWELRKVLASKESVKLEAVRGEAPPSRRSREKDARRLVSWYRYRIRIIRRQEG